MRKIQLGWPHFDENKQNFVSVRLINGSGTRDVNVPINSTKDDIVKLCMELFFPNGHSEFAGDATALDFRLVNSTSPFLGRLTTRLWSRFLYQSRRRLGKCQMFISNGKIQICTHKTSYNTTTGAISSCCFHKT